MHILFVSPCYYPSFKYGGPIYSTYGLNKAIVKKGVNVTVYTTNAGLEDRVLVNQELDIDGVKVTYFAYTRFFDFLSKAGWQFSLPLAKALKENVKNLDLIHINSLWNFPVAVSSHYCRKYKKPYIISPQGSLYLYALNKKYWRKLLYLYFISKRDLKSAAGIHYTTEDEAEKIHPLLVLKNAVIIVPNGIDLSEFVNLPDKGILRKRYPYLKNKKIILFLGRIHWIKGLDILVKAFSKLVKERNDVHLLIVGGDEEGYGKKIKRLIKDYRLNYRDSLPTEDLKTGNTKSYDDTQVTFTGMLTGREKLETLVGSDILILPSYLESFGISAVEAMACGIPTIISDKVGISKKVLQNRSGIVIKTNTESLYNGIQLFLNDKALRSQIEENARDFVARHYDINKIADKMIGIYRAIIDKKPLPKESCDLDFR